MAHFDRRPVSSGLVISLDFGARHGCRSILDFITAMDVFEHLADPASTIRDLWRALKRGGFLFGRFHSKLDEDRPHHIVLDFTAALEELASLGFVKVWRDQWLWGHEVFQKT